MSNIQQGWGVKPDTKGRCKMEGGSLFLIKLGKMLHPVWTDVLSPVSLYTVVKGNYKGQLNTIWLFSLTPTLQHQVQADSNMDLLPLVITMLNHTTKMCPIYLNVISSTTTGGRNLLHQMAIILSISMIRFCQAKVFFVLFCFLYRMMFLCSGANPQDKHNMFVAVQTPVSECVFHKPLMHVLLISVSLWADRGHSQSRCDIYSSEAYGDSPLYLVGRDYLRTLLACRPAEERWRGEKRGGKERKTWQYDWHKGE